VLGLAASRIISDPIGVGLLTEDLIERLKLDPDNEQTHALLVNFKK
jgi:hypothetical protein